MQHLRPCRFRCSLLPRMWWQARFSSCPREPFGCPDRSRKAISSTGGSTVSCPAVPASSATASQGMDQVGPLQRSRCLSGRNSNALRFSGEHQPTNRRSGAARQITAWSGPLPATQFRHPAFEDSPAPAVDQLRPDFRGTIRAASGRAPQLPRQLRKDRALAFGDSVSAWWRSAQLGNRHFTAQVLST